MLALNPPSKRAEDLLSLGNSPEALPSRLWGPFPTLWGLFGQLWTEGVQTERQSTAETLKRDEGGRGSA